VHLLDAVDEVIYAGEVLPYLNRLGRLLFLFSLCRIILLLFFLTFFLLLLRLFGLAWVNTLEGGLLFLLFFDLFECSSALFFFGLLWESVSRLDFVLDISEANKHGADVFNDARLQADALLLKKLAEVLDVNAFLVALLTVLINKDALDGLQVVSQVHSEARAGLTVAGQEAAEGLQEGCQIEMSRLFIGLLLFVETALLLKFGNGCIDLLGLLLSGKSTFLGSGRTVIAVLAPIGEVAVSFGNVVLGETEYFQGLNEEVLL
jgi:hypothetical protein